MKELPTRKTNRLKHFDYNREGVYFLTLCAKERKCLFSHIRVGAGVLDSPQAVLTHYGEIIRRQLEEINRRYEHLEIEHYVIMPNHLHLLVRVKNGGSPKTTTPTQNTISAFVSMLKRFTNKSAQRDLWQRSFYDHIVRDEEDYQTKYRYISENPAKWAEDQYYEKKNS